MYVHLHFFVRNGQQFSAVSNGKPVEAFCRDWFGESCEDSSGQVDMDQRVQSRRHGGQERAVAGIEKRDDSAWTGTAAVWKHRKGQT